MQTSKPRYPLIDAIRGLSVVSMVLFHFSYDVFMVWGVNYGWYSHPLVRIWQQLTCSTFILVSGFVWRWGRKSNLRRGITLNLWGLAVSLVVLIVMPEEAIWFGVLTFLGCALLCMEVLERPLEQVNARVGIALSLFFFLLTKNISFGALTLGTLWYLPLPDVLYDIKVLVLFGFPWRGFFSTDYFPLMPWMFLFLVGYFFQRIFQTNPAWQRIAQRRIPVLDAIGRRSLVIYLVHQPVCYALSMVLLGRF